MGREKGKGGPQEVQYILMLGHTIRGGGGKTGGSQEVQQTSILGHTNLLKGEEGRRRGR